jgi:hypothetical protein
MNEEKLKHALFEFELAVQQYNATIPNYDSDIFISKEKYDAYINKLKEDALLNIRNQLDEVNSLLNAQRNQTLNI